MDHSNQPLIDYIVSRSSTQSRGPIPEFLAKKEAEKAPKTHEWYRDSLMQLWAFLEQNNRTTLAEFDDSVVNLFRLHLRKRGLVSSVT